MGLDMYLYKKEVEKVAYWRKANAIHGWFMQFTDVDDCTPVHVSRDRLIELRDTCFNVLAVHKDDLAEQVLPPTEGFFFGSNEIDEYYWENLEETVKVLTKIIDSSTEYDMFEYVASW